MELLVIGICVPLWFIGLVCAIALAAPVILIVGILLVCAVAGAFAGMKTALAGIAALFAIVIAGLCACCIVRDTVRRLRSDNNGPAAFVPLRCWPRNSPSVRPAVPARLISAAQCADQ